jgi:hypothetical protein
MPFLVADGGAAGVAGVADALFREVVAFGVLASGQQILVEQLRQYLPRIGTLAEILDVAEPAGLGFGSEPFPYWANTENWGPSLPLAGHTTPAGGPRPSQVVASLWEAWTTALASPSRSARHSLLLAALWAAWHDGLGSALQLTMDLSCSGYLLNRDDLEAVVTLLLAARAATGSDREMVSRLLGGAELDSAEALASAALTTDWVTVRQPASPAVGRLVHQILRSLLALADTARRSQGLDEWLLNQQRLYNVIGPTLSAIRSVMPQIPLMMQSAVADLAEINADAGSFCGLIKLRIYGDPSYSTLVAHALPAMFEYRRLMGEDWQEGLFGKRVLVPDELRSLMFDINGDWPPDLFSVCDPASGFVKRQVDHQAERCPEAWRELSYELAHPFVCALRPELKGPELTGAPATRPPGLAEYPLVVQACARHGISDPDARRHSVAQAMRSRPARFLTDRDRSLWSHISQVESGLIPFATEIDLNVGLPPAAAAEPVGVDDEVIQAVADASAEINRIRLREASKQAAGLLVRDEPELALLSLLAIQRVLPWSAEIWDGLTAAVSRMGDLPAQRHAVQAALHLQPRQSERWRLLAAILADQSGPGETVRVTNAIADRWTSSGAVFNF